MQVNVGLRAIVFAAACGAGACSVDSRNVSPIGGSGGAGGSAGGAGAGGAAGAGAGTGGGASGSAGAGGSGGAGMAGGASGSSASVDGGSDPSDSGMGGSAGGGTWCDTQTPSVGVAAADFQCLDFETEVEAAVWVSEVTGTATLGTSTEKAFSPATSLRSFVPDAAAFADRTVATLAWSNVGASAVAGVRVAMQINPAGFGGLTPEWDGSIALVCVEFGSGSACLHYTRTGPATLFLPWSFVGGAAIGGQCPVSGALQVDLWNQVELIVGSDSSVRVLLNGVEATTDCTASFGADTVANVTVGLQSRQTTYDGWTVHFDDIVAETER